MADKMDKPTAASFSAGLQTTQGLSPLQWSDKCFLCNREIGESDPRGFYQGSNSMALCHRGCLVIMETNGGTPADYHRATDEAAPVQEQQQWAVPEDVRTGPSWLDFPDLKALWAYTKDKGPIPDGVKVTIAGQVIQA